MRRAALLCILTVAVFAACHKPTGQNGNMALARVRAAPSALPGLSVERAVEQILADMSHQVAVKRGRWYCNPAIEHEGEDAYKVGYEFTQAGKTARFAWTYFYDDDRLEALTDYARQVRP